MPTYQYRCTSCGEDLEVFQKFTEASLTECPACHGELRKVFNAVGVVFKGSGFYKTDSRSSTKPSSGSHSTKHGADKPADKPAAATPAAKSEASPAAASA